MHRPASDREAIEAELDRVRSLGLDELRTLWRVTFRSPPPSAFTKDLMARFLCWHIQEQAQGGLDLKTAKHLDGLARGAKPGANRPTRLKPGTVLLREFQGERHTVTVVPDGYMWHETTYASLSTIARAITGTAWSGPRFFGLRGGGEPAALSKGADMLLIASNERPSGRAARLTSRPAIGIFQYKLRSPAQHGVRCARMRQPGTYGGCKGNRDRYVSLQLRSGRALTLRRQPSINIKPARYRKLRPTVSGTPFPLAFGSRKYASM